MTYSGGTSGSAVSGGTPLSGTVDSNDRAPIFPLEAWRKTVGYHPYHFWGVMDTSGLKVTSACNTLLPQYSWQAQDRIARHNISEAILTAESRLRDYLNYSVGRRFVQETLPFPRPRHYGHQYGAHIDADGRWLGLRLSEGYVRNIGCETYSLIEANTAVTYSDSNGDGYTDTFTITFSTTVTNPDELGVYFKQADRNEVGTIGNQISERFRIAPVNIRIASGTATIKGPAWVMVRPLYYEGVTAATGFNLENQDDDEPFAEEVDVYRRYADPTGITTDTAQAVLIWETDPWPVWATGCGGSGLTYADGSRDPAALAYAIARVNIRNARRGEVALGHATYNSTTGQWVGAQWGDYRSPDRVTIRYEAGVEIDALESTNHLGRLISDWDRVVARFACAEMPVRQFSCDEANHEIYRWQAEMARAGGNETFKLSESDLNNPFGTQAGHIYAWRRVSQMQLARPFLV